MFVYCKYFQENFGVYKFNPLFSFSSFQIILFVYHIIMLSKNISSVLKSFGTGVSYKSLNKLSFFFFYIHKHMWDITKLTVVVCMILCNDCDNVYISEIGSTEIRLRQHVGAFKSGKLNSKLVQPASETYHTPSFKSSSVFKSNCSVYHYRLFIENWFTNLYLNESGLIPEKHYQPNILFHRNKHTQKIHSSWVVKILNPSNNSGLANIFQQISKQRRRCPDAQK